MGKRVLVMGGSYFIGNKIVDELLHGGYEVCTLNRGSKEVHDDRIHNIICDRNDKDRMAEVLRGEDFDIIVDVCGLTREHMDILCSSVNMDNLESFVFISSSAVYDVENIDAPYCENDKQAENKYWTFYGKGKIESEEYLVDRFGETAVSLSILRPPYMYGENNYAQRESFIFDHILEDRPILVPNDGETEIQFYYTGDLAGVILKLLERKDQEIGIYNVGNKKACSFMQWIRECEKVVGKNAKIVLFPYEQYSREVREFFPFFDYDNILDVSRVNEVYHYETPFQEGLKKSYEWYIENRDDIEWKESVVNSEEDILKSL